jgi:hypothetical protein
MSMLLIKAERDQIKKLSREDSLKVCDGEGFSVDLLTGRPPSGIWDQAWPF